jgi:hypothetical protein
MRWGFRTALAVSFSLSLTAAAHATDSAPHRHYDRDADCSVFDLAGLAAEDAAWDGPCARGNATGHGTAAFFTRDGDTETITADFRDGLALNGSARIRWADGAHYEGETMEGRPGGDGALVTAKGDRFSGAWKDGALNGHGAVVWANGDRYEGEWLDGKAEGHGVQIWADGRKYDGLWHNDMPNGQGTVTRKDGTQYVALFVDGKRQPAPQVAAPAPAATAESAPATATPEAHGFFEAMSGRTLVAVDGATLTLTAKENGLVRAVRAPDGSLQKTAFTFLGNGLGTISSEDAAQVGGVFHLTATGVEADYVDGHVELLTRAGADGLFVLSRSAGGEEACTAWYPGGHAFSAGERKLAVAAYARRLGLADAAPPPQGGCLTQSNITTPASALNAPPPPHHKPARPGRPAPLSPASLTVPADGLNALQNVPVRPSTVHLIDAGPAGGIASPAATPAIDESIASNCLKVDNDGSYWGFRNHCGYNVQFAYCLLHGADPMTRCDGANAVPGSVSASGFGALFAGDSPLAHNADRAFRWVGCRGGAGEVAAHLDQPDPASGRCVRATRDLAREN